MNRDEVGGGGCPMLLRPLVNMIERTAEERKGERQGGC